LDSDCQLNTRPIKDIARPERPRAKTKTKDADFATEAKAKVKD